MLILAAGAGGLVMLRGSLQAGDPQLTANETAQAKSPFSLNTGATDGWYMGPASETSLAVFGKKPDAAEEDKTHFAIIDYKTDGATYDDWLQELASRSHASYTFVSGDIISAALQTTDEPISYELRTYTNQLKSGKAKSLYGLNDAEVHGFIPYKDGYIRIQGYATPGEVLPEVIEAIQALHFDTSKL